MEVSVVVPVYGMTCVNCTNAVERAVRQINGVLRAQCDLQRMCVDVTFEKDTTNMHEITEAVEDAGFDTVEESDHEQKVSLVSTTIEYEAMSQGNSLETPKPYGSASRLTTTILAIQGMTCGSCTAAIESQVNSTKVPGLATFSISLISERAAATHDASLITAAELAEMVEDCGFDAQVVSSSVALDEIDRKGESKTKTITMKVFGMHCASCVNKIESGLRALDGIMAAVVSLSLEEAKITYDTAQSGLRDIVDAIHALGFDAILAEATDNAAQLESLARTRESQEWRNTFWRALTLTVPVFLINKLIPHLPGGMPVVQYQLLIPGLRLGDVLSLLLTLPVQFGIGKRFYKSAYKSLKHGSATMDVLVSLGTSASFVFSLLSMLVAVISVDHPSAATFFDTSGMLITFVTFGRYLENKAKGSTSAALSKLMSLAPSSATIHDTNYELEKTPIEKVIPTELIQVGDVVILKPGAKVPADGIVIAGSSYVDESMVTGEVKPLKKQKSSLVVAGTVNGCGRLDFRVQRTGRDTQLAQIVKLVQEAQTTKAPIQRFSDIVAGYFVPTVISLGLLTFLTWMVLSHVLQNPPMIFLHHGAGGKFMTCLKLCISVIVVACPCALGLATPTAVMVGTGMAASHGVLIKGGAVLETATKVTRVVFDKTGTLTYGQMSVQASKISDSWLSRNSARRWWSLIGAAEQNSEHPIGKAIVDKARSELSLSEGELFPSSTSTFEAVSGSGITCLIESDEASASKFAVLVGTKAFLAENGIKADFEETFQQANEQCGRSCIFVAIEGQFAGVISLSDQVKPDATTTISALRRMGKEVSMVTGDQYSTALKIAEQVGIPATSVWAAITPGGKKDIIQQMQRNGEVVAMVGDGINDSPALAVADIGIAMSSGTDVAIEAADIVLMRQGTTLDVAVALLLSNAIFRRIKLNLLWACLYNLVAIPFAMGFFLPFGLHLHPMIAGGAMAMSSVSVVCSSLLLKYWQVPAWLEDESSSGPLKRTPFLQRFRRVGKGYQSLDEEEMSLMPVS
ncbi:Putative uncharacterized protein [Taphrina deformans PYCC 5710]|uniref:P-type Cu(+) transporter n=1 Tax=Taphrina deformans (strain PYCC 5710 / ATCC 11124 / CBS 356.35 / IMI 108563 / JCM 9778 / NBRC 8474) TaxID=1097556 RepID=R4XC67_TAPDE|nr:Putative uncharacterized protein [Taphrina deformans PYCC 5710]|eukprot:CCG83416.1 Putative uncharacterized protein [Taphrina deformans PYCC 5710]